MSKTWIPEVSDERLQELGACIKPVIRFTRGEWRHYKTHNKIVGFWFELKPNGELHQHNDGEQYFIEPVDLRKVSFVWDPNPTEKATGLKPLCDITTYHSWSYYGFFKPSIAEVLAQIPAECVNAICAFELVEVPETADDFNKDREAFNKGYHVATTRLFVRES